MTIDSPQRHSVVNLLRRGEGGLGGNIPGFYMGPFQVRGATSEGKEKVIHQS